MNTSSNLAHILPDKVLKEELFSIKENAMLSGLWSIAAKVAVPLISNAIQSAFGQTSANNRQAPMSLEHTLAQQINLKEMSKTQFDALTGDLYNMGAINLDELNQLHQFNNQLASPENDGPINYVEAIKNYLSDNSNANTRGFKLLNGLNEIREHALSVRA